MAAHLTNKVCFQRRAATECRPYSCYIVVQLFISDFEAKLIRLTLWQECKANRRKAWNSNTKHYCGAYCCGFAARCEAGLRPAVESEVGLEQWPFGQRSLKRGSLSVREWRSWTQWRWLLWVFTQILRGQIQRPYTINYKKQTKNDCDKLNAAPN